MFLKCADGGEAIATEVAGGAGTQFSSNANAAREKNFRRLPVDGNVCWRQRILVVADLMQSALLRRVAFRVARMHGKRDLRRLGRAK